MSEREDWREEQQRVDDIVSLIEKRLQELDQEARDKKEDVVRIRRNFWDDVTLNFDEPDEAVETYASMKQQAEVLAERERSFESAQKQVKTLRKLKDSPYFGRIDFKENGERQAERIYLGIASLLDEDEAEFLIYDWRAPISSLYYDYPPGARTL